jgi:cation transport ATPase
MLSFFSCINCFAQKGSQLIAPIDTSQANLKHYTDSAVMARQHFVEDSLMMLYIKYPDPNRHNVFVDSILKHLTINPLSFADGQPVKQHIKKTGKERTLRPQWIIAVIIFLLIYTGLLNLFMGKDIYGVLQAFYSKRAFASINNEDSLLSSWAFIALFSLFGFTIGLYLYQLIVYKQLSFATTGFQLFFTLSVIVIVLFVLKILTLQAIGFVFDIGRLVKEYISVLYLTYFNLAFIFLPLVICFGLLSTNFKPYLLLISYALIALIFAIQYLRSTINIISKFRFHKIYLFIYLCALEICPILILIKALDL